MMAWKSSILKFKFNDFAALTSEPGESVFSTRKTDGDGNKWKLNIKPGGDVGGDSVDPKVSVYLYLHLKRAETLHAMVTFILRDAAGKVYCERSTSIHLFGARGISWGFKDFIKRSDILNKENNILLREALHIDVLLQIQPEAACTHVPSNPFRTNMLKLLENTDDADASFDVNGTIIHAHKLILKMNAPLLYDICEGDHKEGSPIPFKTKSPQIFHIILRYIYGGDVSELVTVGNGKDVITAADRCGIQGLKISAESILVQSLELHEKNLADWLLFADSHTCPLLKERAISYATARAADLINSKWTEKLMESPKLMKELLVETTTSLANDPRFEDAQRNMSVNELRKSLDEKGMDVDGSKTTLISRLQESNKRQRTE